MKKIENYHTIKKLRLGQTQVEVCIETIPTEIQLKQYLTKIYDVVNNIAVQAEKRGIDTSNWFYTDEEIEKMKKDPLIKFL